MTQPRYEVSFRFAGKTTVTAVVTLADDGEIEQIDAIADETGLFTQSESEAVRALAAAHQMSERAAELDLEYEIFQQIARGRGTKVD